MPTFDMNKDAGDIQEAEIMPEDWYTFEIADEPEQVANAHMKALSDGKANLPNYSNPGAPGPDADETRAGYNILLKLKVVNDDPRFNGRPFRIWLPLPIQDHDAKRFTPIGQTQEDSKMERLVEFAAAFNDCPVEGSSVSFDKGQCANLYVQQELARNGEDMINSINTFSGAKPVLTDDGMANAQSDAEVPGDDIPF